MLSLAPGPGEAESELTLLGLALLWDPPRPEVPEVIRQKFMRFLFSTNLAEVLLVAVGAVGAYALGLPALRTLLDLEPLDAFTLALAGGGAAHTRAAAEIVNRAISRWRGSTFPANSAEAP